MGASIAWKAIDKDSNCLFVFYEYVARKVVEREIGLFFSSDKSIGQKFFDEMYFMKSCSQNDRFKECIFAEFMIHN